MSKNVSSQKVDKKITSEFDTLPKHFEIHSLDAIYVIGKTVFSFIATVVQLFVGRKEAESFRHRTETGNAALTAI